MNLEYYFNILEMPVTHDMELVNKKYHELIKKYHPDINHEIDSEAKSIEIIMAYNEIKKHLNEQIMNEKRGVSGNNDINNNGTYEENNVQDCEIDSFTEEILRDLKILSLSLKLTLKKYKEFCLKCKEEYQCFIEFKDWLKEEISKNKLIKNIGLSEDILRKNYDDYCFLVKKQKQIPYEFNRWLEVKLREKNLIEALNSNYETCLKHYEMYRENIKFSNCEPMFFIEWLESKLVEQNMLKSLNMTYDMAINQYNSYCLSATFNGYLFYSFSEWLRIIYKDKIKTYKKKV